MLRERASSVSTRPKFFSPWSRGKRLSVAPWPKSTGTSSRRPCRRCHSGPLRSSKSWRCVGTLPVAAASTGNVPTHLHDLLDRNGPEWHLRQGRRLDVPVLFGQGATDNLFPLDQGLKNFGRVLTDEARSRSIFVGYNGGHTLPAVLPA